MDTVTRPDENKRLGLHRLFTHSRTLLAGWTAIVGALFVADYVHIERLQYKLARTEAHANFNKDQAIRFWSAGHGGVYVPATSRTPPNPFLSHVTERDLTTDSGRTLTLMNPAYMLRQMMTDYQNLFGIRAHITSLKYFRPETMPDAWERSALAAFERGETEVSELTDMEGEPHLRLMRPMLVKKGCLKCHAEQGYKPGDIRGGVSVAMPMSRYAGNRRQTLKMHFAALGILWLLGAAGIIVTTRRLQTHIKDRDSARAAHTRDLRAANAELTRADRLKDEFLANMSHELRTPLTSILGMSEALLEQSCGPLNDRQVKSLRTVEGSGRHLLNLINDILDLSRISAGKMELRTGRVSVEEICRVSLRMVTEMARKKGQRITCENAGGCDFLTADMPRLKQILVNLLTNAVKFTPEGGEIGLVVNRAAGGRTIEFTVRDTGPGIPARKLKTVFDPFVQLDGTASRRHEGTGLGLALVRKLADLHGGSVRIDSEVGKFTRVTVALPVTSPHGRPGSDKEDRGPGGR